MIRPFIIISAVFSQIIFAQITINHVSVNVTEISAFESHFLPNETPIFPEIKVGGELFKKNFEWSLSYGYWFENQKVIVVYKGDPVDDKFFGHRIGFGINFYPMNTFEGWVLPVHVLAGCSFNYIYKDNLYKSYSCFSQTYDEKTNLLTFELGVGLNILFFETIRLRAEAAVMKSIYENDVFYREELINRLNAGIDYYF